MIKRLARCIREYKWTALVSPLAMVGEVSMEVTIPLVMADLYDYGIAARNMNIGGEGIASDALRCGLSVLRHPIRHLRLQSGYGFRPEPAP